MVVPVLIGRVQVLSDCATVPYWPFTFLRLFCT